MRISKKLAISTHLCALTIAAASLPAAAQSNVDTLITGGTVYIGDLSDGRRVDVGIKSDRIVFIGDASAEKIKARKRIDAAGMIVSPGFIDAHSHFELQDFLSADPGRRASLSNLAQGATTNILGVDGDGPSDVGALFSNITKSGVGLNLATYVGFQNVREQILGQSSAAPSPAQLDQMKALVRQGMCDGAIGFSTGLFYEPEAHASTAEVIAVAREAGALGGVYDSHIRDEAEVGPAGYGFVRSVAEVIRIAREANMPGHIGHMKATGASSSGKSKDAIALVEAARAEGLEITADQYPYLASGGSLGSTIMPRWATEGGRPKALERLADPVIAERIKADMKGFLAEVDGAKLFISVTESPWRGKTLADLARLWNLSEVDAAVRLYQEGNPGMNVFGIDPADFRRLMVQPWMSTSSDGGWIGDLHPRNTGTFPTIYADYVRREPLLTTAQFIHRSSGATADALRLPERGYIKLGYHADIAIFDPETYGPRSTYFRPDLIAEGVRYTIVNGQIAFEKGDKTGKLAGQAIVKAKPQSCN